MVTTKTYAQDPEGFKSAWLNENNKKGIRIEFPEFKERVRPVGTENPKSLGWYEHNKTNAKYELTNDLFVIEDKPYFKTSINPLVYTDVDIENDSFNFKKSIQNGSNADFIGCISSSVKFKVSNDYKYLKDQILNVTVNVTEKLNGDIYGPLGTFHAGGTYQIPEWDINNQDFINEINNLGYYESEFTLLDQPGSHLNYREYLQECQRVQKGLASELLIPPVDTIIREMKIFTGLVDEVKLDKSRSLTREITAYDYMHKLANDYDITDWYVWQYGDSNADNAQVEIQTYSSYQYLPYEGREDILYQTVDDGLYYKWIADPYVESGPPGRYENTQRNFRTRTVKQLRDSFWQFVCNSGTVYDPIGQALKQKGEGWPGQVRNASLINDTILIPKSLNVSPVDFDKWISGELVGGPFERHPKDKEYGPDTQYDVYNVSGGWNVNDLVARKQIIELGLVGTLFTYGGKSETNYREYMDDCDNSGAGIAAQIKIPREEQEKLRETQITASTVLQAICQYNGVFGQFNANGEFEYIKLDTIHPIEIDDKYQIEVGYSDSRMPSITGVVIFDKSSEEYSADNIQTEYGEVKNGKKGSALAYYPDDRTKVVGKDSHTYIIDDNFLFNAFNQKDAINVAKTIYDQISNLTVRNANLTIKAMPWLQCGQAISYYAPTENTLIPSEDLAPSETLYPMDYEHIVSLIMTYEISGTGLLKGKIECKVEDVSNQIVNLNEVISAEMFYRKIGDNRQFSEFQQTANQIKLQVTDRERRLKSYIDVRADSIELQVTGPGGAISRIAVLENEVDIQSNQITLMGGNIDLLASNQVNIQSQIMSLQAEQITLKANRVTFEDLAGKGRTVISGDNITTGSIDGKYIRAGSISCDRIAFGRITVDGQTYDVDWTRVSYTDIARVAAIRSRANSWIGTGAQGLITIKLGTSTSSGYVNSVWLEVNGVQTNSFTIPGGWTQVPILTTDDYSEGNRYAYGIGLLQGAADYSRHNLVTLGADTKIN